MKRLVLLNLLIFATIFTYRSHAQEYAWYSSSNYYEPHIIFSNPAGISLRASREGVFSSQLLFAGLGNDKLYNYYLGYSEPIGGFGVIAVRGFIFNSFLTNQSAFSVLYSKSFLDSRLSFAINFNLHYYSYDKDKFQLIDIDDPLLSEGTATSAFGVGLSTLYNPLTGLVFGLSLDNVNQPDISLQGGNARKPLIGNFGISYRIFNLVPEFDMRYIYTSHRTETYYVFGLRQLLPNYNTNILMQYQQDGVALGAAYSFNSFRLDYRYAYPLNELQGITSGSHQFTLSYSFGKDVRYPTSPVINLFSAKNTEIDTGSYLLQAQVEDRSGLKNIIIELIGKGVTRYDYTQKNTNVTIDIPISPLKKGMNEIKIIAGNDSRQSSEEIKVVYDIAEKIPVIVSTPKIEILTPLQGETNASSLRIKLSVEFILELKDVIIKINDKSQKLQL